MSKDRDPRPSTTGIHLAIAGLVGVALMYFILYDEYGLERRADVAALAQNSALGVREKLMLCAIPRLCVGGYVRFAGRKDFVEIDRERSEPGKRISVADLVALSKGDRWKQVEEVKLPSHK